MQSSFWKTVSIVGVIGIGSLVILEVQNRLPRQGSAANTTGDANLTELASDSAEQAMEAMLSESQFDRMLAQSESPSPKFAAQEPPLSTAPSDQGAMIFSGGDQTASVDRFQPAEKAQPQLTAASLAQDGNPFSQADSAEIASASWETEGPDSGVRPAGFAEADSEVGSTTPEFKPFDLAEPPASPTALKPTPSEPADQLSDAPFAAFDQQPSQGSAAKTPSANATGSDAGDSFPFFPEDTSVATTTQPAPSQENHAVTVSDASSGPADNAPANTAVSPSPSKSQPFLFFGEQQGNAPTRTVAATAPQSAADHAQPFYGSENTAPSSSEPNRPFGAGSEPPRLNPEPFPGLPDRTSPPPSTNSEDASGEFFSEDPVPQPRSLSNQLQDRPFDVPLQGNGSSGFGQSLPDNSGLSRPSGPEPQLRPAPMDNSSLPFAEDIGSEAGSRPFSVPELTDPSESKPRAVPQPDTFTIPGSSFSDYQNRAPVESSPPPRMETTPGFSNGVREFDGIREFGSGPPSIQPRPFEPQSNSVPENSGVREFNSTPSLSAPREVYPNRPTDNVRDYGTNGFGNEPVRPNVRQEIRQVSGVMSPNLVLEKSAPENATVGAPLDYRIVVRNEGDATAYEVVVEDEVKSSARVEGARPQSEFDKATQKLIWKFEEIEPGDSREIVVRVTPTGEGTLDGVATVRFKARVKATTVITAPRLRLQMTGPKEVKVGEEVAFRYVITNDGTGEARDVFVRTLLPSNGGLKHPQGRDLEYEIQSMRPGEQREVVLKVAAADAGEFRTEAEVTAAGNVSDQASWRTAIIGAQLQIVRRGPKRRFVGRPGTYENVVSNETNFPALNAKVVEQVPAGMRFLSATRGGQYNEADRTVTWYIDRLEAGRQELLEIELMPTTAGAQESVVRVLENAGFRSDDYVSTTVVEDLHNVSADISQLDGPVALNETFGFSISIDNRGTADATDIELAIEIPDEIEVIGAGSPEVQAKLLDGNVVQYNTVVRIEPGQKQTFEVKLKGVAPVRNGLVKAKVRYRQMEEPLIVSESVTVYREEL
ncbi:MAG: DUF11 domain-containing protein [Planctomycetaceae bacterium]|nr:DUF11 domain-containing protein [Planctomycetaceae bacterium]